jgi:large subunit ribosomal protein L4
MKTTVYNQKLESVGEADLNSKIYEVEPVVELVQQAVRVQMNNSRPSSANTKTRGEVRGGGRKPWKQKGTGNARAGSNRSPIWVGGGITFGPRANRNWSLKMNKKQWRKALYMTLSDKASENKIVVFSDLELPTFKTKDMVAMIKNLGSKVATDSKKFLFITPKKNENLAKATRNLKNAKVINADSLNVVDILQHDSIVMTQASLPVIEKTYLK